MSTIEVVMDTLPELLPMTGRSKGMHVSDIIHDICIKRGYYEARERDPDAPFVPTMKMKLGAALERSIIAALHQQFPDRYVEIGEVSADGIFGTLDLYDAVLDAVVEMKLTWMSSRHKEDMDGPKMWKYWCQGSTYAHMVHTPRVVLMVCFVNGDYRGGEPEFHGWLRTYEPHEIAENWALIRSHGRALAESRIANG